jgi:hypothetical protein
VVGFIFIAVLLDILLVAWFHFTRTRVFANRVILLVGDASDRVRYLWTPPLSFNGKARDVVRNVSAQG